MANRMQRDLADRELGRALGRKITRLRRHVRELEIASQGAFRSVEDGAIDVYDDDGVLRERIGKQTDGTYGRKSFTGEIPPAPTEPDVVVISDGVVAVSWDGRFEERYGGDFRNVQIHLGDTADFTPTRNTQEGAIFARRGGTVVCLTESDDDNPVWVRLVATNRAGEASPPSDAVLVDETDADSLDDEQEELQWEDRDGHTLTAADIAAGTVTFGLSHLPEEKSVIAFLGGVRQEATNYTVDYDAPSVTWPLNGWEPAGLRIGVHYPYYEGEGTAPLHIPIGHVWRYQTGLGPSTAYAEPAFDDSSWSQGPTPFGWAGATYPDAGSIATTVPSPLNVWQRLVVTTNGGDLTFTAPLVDDDAKVYIDGTLVQTLAFGYGKSFTVPCPAGDHVIAIYGTDKGNQGSATGGWSGFAITEG